MRTRAWVVVLVSVVLPFAPLSEAQEACPTVLTSSGHVSIPAKPDLAIVFMVVRSSAGIAADALAANQKKEQEVEARLAVLGLKGKFQFSGNRFGPSGPPNYGQPRTGVTGFDVSEFVYVFLDVASFPGAAQLEKRVSEVIDELTRAGASPVDTHVPRLNCQQSSCTVAFAVKDAAKYVRQAREQATKEARESGEAMAKALGTEIVGIRSANAGSQLYQGQPQGANPLEDLPYDFLSASALSVPVTVSVTLQFVTKPTAIH